MAQTIDEVLNTAQALFFSGRIDDALQLLQDNETLTVAPADQNRLLILHSEILIVRTWLKPHTPLDRAQTMLASALEHAVDDDQRAAALMATGRLHYFPMFQAEAPDATVPLNFFTQANQIWQNTGNKRGICESQFWIGLIYQIFLLDLEKAERYFRAALELAEAHEFKLEKSYLVRHLGFIAQKRGELDAARTLLEQSLALREEIDFIVYLPFSLLSLGSVCALQGDYRTAETYYNRALSTAESLNFEFSIIQALLALGDLSKQQGHCNTAKQHWERARDLSITHDYPAGAARAEEALSALATTYTKAE